MALKLFIMFAGAFFATSIVVMAITRTMNSQLGNYGKKPWIFNIIASILASGLAFATSYISKNLFTVFWILSAVFLLFGIITVLIIHKKYFRSRPDNRNKVFFSELLYFFSILLLCVAIFSSLQYFLKDENFMHFPMLLCMLFMLIPLLLLHSFDAAWEIPLPQYRYWQYPVDDPIDMPEEDEQERIYVIGLEIPKKTGDKDRTYFTVKAPEKMKLGDLFYHFINDYNELQEDALIEYVDEDGPSDWTFRKKPRWFQWSKLLDGDLTVRDNKIKENTVIICERVES